MSNIISSLLLLLLLASSAFGEANQLLARDNSGGGWGSSLSSGHSFFDIALTALAFLSFGIFLLNLLLNALLFSSGLQPGLTSTGPIITMTAPTATGGATATGRASTGVQAAYTRNKRSIDEIEAIFSVPSNVAAEVLATSAMKSLKVLLNGDESDQQCLPHLMCEGVRQGKVIGKGFQYMMPLYTLSASYIGERLGLHSSLPTHLDAILVGFGGRIPCSSVFPRCPARKTNSVLKSSSSYNSTNDGDSRSNSG